MITDLTSETNDRTTVIPSYHPPLGIYKIEGIKVSKPACILFARHSTSKEGVVFKLLYEYKDTRYNLATVGERQKCQLEALHWNRLFTPRVHIGLAHFCAWNKEQATIEIDEIIQNPSLETLDPNKEYVLLMRQLPAGSRLDNILTEANFDSLQRYTQLLTRYVVHIHTNLPESSISLEDAKKWGSFVHLRKKLMHNLEFLDKIIEMNTNNEYSSYYWLKDCLLLVFEQFKYRHYFEQRIKDGRIKRCHADLKAPNIWIAPLPLPGTPNEYWYGTEPWKYVYLLDAVDFNPMYSHIDILSDFAMLVIDIQARTNSHKLSNRMIEDYLALTHQQDKVARLLLAYYLVEKAIIGAVVSILYDKVPHVGIDFLEVASIRI